MEALDQSKRDALTKIYYDIKNPAGYASLPKLYNEAKSQGVDVSAQDVKKFLRGQFTYTLHKQARKRWKRNPVVVSHPGELFQGDLVEMSYFTSKNNGVKFLLTVIDAFTKYAYAVPLKNKTGKSVRAALEQIFKHQIPQSFQTDQGREFLNSEVQALLKSLKINFYTSKNPQIKCSLIERWNRTLKNKLHKIITAKGTKGKYVHFLDDVVDTYNKTFHRSTKMKPINITHDNRKEVFMNLYGYTSKRDMLKHLKPKRNEVQLGDTVRLQHKNETFERGYWPQWTDNQHIVDGINTRKDRILIKVADNDRRFYKHEVQKIEPNAEYRVEKVIKKRTQNGVTEYYCKFVNYPSSENRWIPRGDLRSLDDD